MTTFADSKNPADDYMVKKNQDGTFYIAVKTYCDCGSPCCSRPLIGDRPHTSGLIFEEEDEAYDTLESLRERWEEQYEDYLEENHDSIRRMEEYESYRNEY